MAPKQMSLSMEHDAGFERHRKATRRDVFLAEMDQVVPWTELCAVIALVNLWMARKAVLQGT